MKQHFIMYSAVALFIGGITSTSFAQTSPDDRVGATLLVPSGQLDIPNNGVIAGAYPSNSRGGWYDWEATFKASSPDGGLTDPPGSANIPYGSQPSGVSLYNDYRLIVLGTDHNVWVTGNSGWTPISSNPPVKFVSRPSICVSSNGLAYNAAVLGADGNVYYATGLQLSGQPLSWGTWSNIGRPPVGANSAPAVASSGIFSMDFAVRGKDGAIWHYGNNLTKNGPWPISRGSSFSQCSSPLRLSFGEIRRLGCAGFKSLA